VQFLDVISGIMFEMVDHGETLKILHGIGYEEGEIERFSLIPLETELPITEAVRTKEAIWVESLDEMRTRYPRILLPRTVRPRAAFTTIPLIVEGQVVGAISISYASAHRFSENDRAFILSLMRYGAQALDRARLYVAERESRLLSEHAVIMSEHAMIRTLRLQSVTAALSQAITPQEVARVIIDEGMNALDAVAGAVWLLSEDGQALELVYTVGHIAAHVGAFRYAELDQPMPITDIIKSGKMMWLESRESYLIRYPHMVPDNRHHAWVLVPLFIQQQAVGCAAYSFAEPRHFPESEREFIATVVQQGSQALDRAALYEAQERATLEAQTAIRNREEFLSVAAHELKTPVTSLQGFTQLLLRGYSKSGAFDVDRLEQSLRQIGYQTNRLTRLVAQLLDISRIESGRLSLEPQPTDLIPLIWRIISATQATTTDHPISLDGPDSLIATVDPLRLEQVITNLVDNAVKYSPDGGPVRIEIGTQLVNMVDQDGDQSEHPNQPMLRIAVIDHGIGIPPEARKAIFERFYQAHKERKLGGLGMGLYISVQIVYLHGGTISVEANPEGGSCFTVLLPLSGEQN
jgi:signal transduction histidine kinase